MRTLLNRTLPLLIATDKQLTPRAQAVYNAMRSMRKTFVSEYIRILGLPDATGRRVIKELLEHDWAYSFRHPVTGKEIIVPWMPADVEAEKAREAEELADTAPNRGEWIVQALLLICVNDPNALYNNRFRWIVTAKGDRKMELDIAFPDSLVAVEFQGRQHYEEVEFENGRTDLQKQMAADRMKFLACERRGYTLVEISDIELSYEAVVQKLEGKIELLQPLKDRPLFRILSKMAKDHAQWARGKRKNPLP